jgi:hypothetical protein
LNFYDPNMMNITIRQNIMSVSESDPRIQTEKEKLSTSVSAVSDPFSSLIATVVGSNLSRKRGLITATTGYWIG